MGLTKEEHRIMKAALKLSYDKFLFFFFIILAIFFAGMTKFFFPDNQNGIWFSMFYVALALISKRQEMTYSLIKKMNAEIERLRGTQNQ